MTRRIDLVCTALVTLLGVGHAALTPVFAPGWTEGAAWFSGAGLALLFLGLLNGARVLDGSRLLGWACLAANALALLWIAFVASVVREPQALLALAAVLGVAACSLATLFRPAHRSLAP